MMYTHTVQNPQDLASINLIDTSTPQTNHYATLTQVTTTTHVSITPETFDMTTYKNHALSQTTPGRVADRNVLRRPTVGLGTTSRRTTIDGDGRRIRTTTLVKKNLRCHWRITHRSGCTFGRTGADLECRRRSLESMNQTCNVNHEGCP